MGSPLGLGFALGFFPAVVKAFGTHGYCRTGGFGDRDHAEGGLFFVGGDREAVGS